MRRRTEVAHHHITARRRARMYACKSEPIGSLPGCEHPYGLDLETAAGEVLQGQALEPEEPVAPRRVSQEEGS